MAAASIPQRILLCGFMGAGKTTVGILLAEQLGWRFLDLDQQIQQQHGQSIAQIFVHHGETHFRAIEADSLTSILGARNIVIALGGGALESAANRSAIASAIGTTLIFLDAPLEILMQRIENQQAESSTPERPLLTDVASANARHAARLPQYRTAALHVETAALDAHAVTANIISRLGLETLARSQEPL